MNIVSAAYAAVGSFGFLAGALIAWLITRTRARDAAERLKIEVAQYEVKISELSSSRFGVSK